MLDGRVDLAQLAAQLLPSEVLRLGVHRLEPAAVDGDDLAVGGGFRSVGGLATTGVALHDGTGWHKRDLTNGAEIGDLGQAMGLAWHGSTLYGLCTGYNGGAVTRWTGSQWDYPQTSFDFPNFDQALVVGGTARSRSRHEGRLQ